MNEDEQTEPKTYSIFRFYRDGSPARKIASGLSLEQAQAHCQDERTHDLEAGWFDGYEEEES